ncbi:NfeD family protein [Flaviflagellibacter deserti]|uniref:NfeD family protein n=1 Tax=Flaviflagellibacter deserti TaxID=2267266 RepID=A0ABV9YXR5_9HYPH
MILGWLESLGVWTWFVLGLLFLGIEIVAPGTFMLWLGVAAIATGLLMLVVDWGWQGQILAFAALSIIAVVGWWRFSRGHGPASSEPVLHRRSELYVGRQFTLEEPIVSGRGRVKIDDTVWRISGPDLAAGTRIRVEGTDGAVLIVAPVA